MKAPVFSQMGHLGVPRRRPFTNLQPPCFEPSTPPEPPAALPCPPLGVWPTPTRPCATLTAAGRAGRRGLDTVGTVLIAAWEEPPPETDLRAVLTGRGVTLSSQFRLTYSMIANLLRVEDLKVRWWFVRLTYHGFKIDFIVCGIVPFAVYIAVFWYYCSEPRVICFSFLSCIYIYIIFVCFGVAVGRRARLHCHLVLRPLSCSAATSSLSGLP